MIDENAILSLIATQMQTIINGNDDYSGYEFTITNELQFVKNKKNNADLKNRAKQIFIVIKFLPATLNYGQTLLPIVINVVAEQNKLNTCYSMLLEYAETYNLVFNSDKTMKQYYSTPTVLSNFNEIGDGFRSLINMSGTFQISEDSNDFDVSMVEDGETIDIPAISVNGSFDVQLESQAFYGTDTTTSTGKVGTFVMNITMYLTDTNLPNACLGIVTKDTTNYPDGVNTTFYFNITFKNGASLSNIAFKLANFTFEKKIGDLPVCTLTFTN